MILSRNILIGAINNSEISSEDLWKLFCKITDYNNEFVIPLIFHPNFATEHLCEILDEIDCYNDDACNNLRDKIYSILNNRKVKY